MRLADLLPDILFSHCRILLFLESLSPAQMTIMAKANKWFLRHCRSALEYNTKELVSMHFGLAILDSLQHMDSFGYDMWVTAVIQEIAETHCGFPAQLVIAWTLNLQELIICVVVLCSYLSPLGRQSLAMACNKYVSKDSSFQRGKGWCKARQPCKPLPHQFA